MFKISVCLVVIALAAGMPGHPNPNPNLIRHKRKIPTSLAKTSTSIVTPIITSGLKSALGMAKGSYEQYKEAAKIESTEGKWLTANFIDLLFTPTVSLLTNQIKDLNIKLEKISQTKDYFRTIIFSLVGIVPSLTLILVLLCILNGRRIQLVKRSLRETDRSVELIRSATAGRGRSSVRRAASPLLDSSAGVTASTSPLSPPVHFKIGG